MKQESKEVKPKTYNNMSENMLKDWTQEEQSAYWEWYAKNSYKSSLLILLCINSFFILFVTTWHFFIGAIIYLSCIHFGKKGSTNNLFEVFSHRIISKKKRFIFKLKPYIFSIISIVLLTIFAIIKLYGK